MARRENPFPGLRPFQPGDADYFFGRNKQREELLERLQKRRFLAVVGTSGSGKSSLVRAGLIPDLRTGYLEGGGPEWIDIIFTPGDKPFAALASKLAERFPGHTAASIRHTLQLSSSGLNQFVKNNLKVQTENLLLIVDQFEEVIRYSSDEGAAFVRMLLTCTNLEPMADPGSECVQDAKTLPTYVVLTMRSDFLGDCSRFVGLPEALSDNQYLVPRLTHDEQRKAIEGPIEMAGAAITPELVQRLLKDVSENPEQRQAQRILKEKGDNPDQLPVLQHALMRTWEESAPDRKIGRAISVQRYVDIGGMQKALDLDANRAYAELNDDPHKEAIAKKLFQCLVNPGNVDEETRRPTPLSQIVKVTRAKEKVTAADESEVRDVIGVFRSRGFLTLSDADDPVVDIPHESLIRLWGRLREWVKEERKSAETYIGLVKAWTEGRGAFRDVALLQAVQWLETQPNPVWANRYTPDDPEAYDHALAFLKKSRKARRNRFFLVLAGTSVVVGALLYATITSRIAARQESSDAAEKAGLLHEADSANAKLTEALRKAALANIQAVEARKVADAERIRALNALALAESEKHKAVASAKEAQAAKILAESQKAEAVAARDEAVSRETTDRAYRDGVTKYLSADQAGAIAKFTEALESYEAEKDYDAAAVTLVNIGLANAARNKPDWAIDYFENAIDLYYSKNLDPKGKAVALDNLGNQYAKLAANVSKQYPPATTDQAAADITAAIITQRDLAIDAYKDALKIFVDKSDWLNAANVADKIAQQYNWEIKDTTDTKKFSRSVDQGPSELALRDSEISYLKQELEACKRFQKPDLPRQAKVMTEVGDRLIAEQTAAANSEAAKYFSEANRLDIESGASNDVVNTFKKWGKALPKDSSAYTELSNRVEQYYRGISKRPNGDPFYNPDASIADYYQSVDDPKKALAFNRPALELYLKNLDLASTLPIYRRSLDLEWISNQDAAVDAYMAITIYAESRVYLFVSPDILVEFLSAHKINKEDIARLYKDSLAKNKKGVSSEGGAYALYECAAKGSAGASLVACIAQAGHFYNTSENGLAWLAYQMVKAKSAIEAGDRSTADASYREALQYALQSGNKPAEIRIRQAIASNHYGEGARDVAMADYVEIAKLYNSLGYKYGEALAYYRAGGYADDAKKPDPAVEYYNKSQEILAQADDKTTLRKNVLQALATDCAKVNPSCSKEAQSLIDSLSRSEDSQ